MASGASVNRRRTPGIQAIPRIVYAARQPITREIADVAKDKMQELAPVRTGKLKKSIKIRFIRYGEYMVVVEAPYGKYVEGGTRHMRAQPFFMPGLVYARSVSAAIVKKHVKERINRHTAGRYRGVDAV